MWTYKILLQTLYMGLQNTTQGCQIRLQDATSQVSCLSLQNIALTTFVWVCQQHSFRPAKHYPEHSTQARRRPLQASHMSLQEAPILDLYLDHILENTLWTYKQHLVTPTISYPKTYDTPLQALHESDEYCLGLSKYTYKEEEDCLSICDGDRGNEQFDSIWHRILVQCRFYTEQESPLQKGHFKCAIVSHLPGNH